MSSIQKIFFFILKCLFLRKLFCFPMSNETLSIYDQRQTGKYNIHISLRDVAIIEVDKNGFSDDTINNSDEYYYDDEDLTINPTSLWVSTTIKTPQIIVNASQIETVVLQNIKDNKQIVGPTAPSSEQQQNQQNFVSPESNLKLTSNPSPSEGITLDSVAKEPVSPVASEPRLMYIPLQKIIKAKRKENSLSDNIDKGHKINAAIPSDLSLPNIPVTCRNYQFRDANGNCRSLKRHPFLQNLFQMLKLMRIKN